MNIYLVTYKLLLIPNHFFVIHKHILSMALRQQSNLGKITSLALGKLSLRNCIHATLQCLTTSATVLFHVMNFQEW